jgi:hypothetical protein
MDITILWRWHTHARTHARAHTHHMQLTVFPFQNCPTLALNIIFQMSGWVWHRMHQGPFIWTLDNTRVNFNYFKFLNSNSVGMSPTEDLKGIHAYIILITNYKMIGTRLLTIRTQRCQRDYFCAMECYTAGKP